MQLLNNEKTFGNLCLKEDTTPLHRNVHVNAYLFTSIEAGAGKDFCAEKLPPLLGTGADNSILEYKFATPLLTAFQSVFRHQGKDFHKVFPKRRPNLIKFSKACKEIEEDIWINRTIDSMRIDIRDFCTSTLRRNLHFIFSDLRYEYERKAIQDLFRDEKDKNKHIVATNIHTILVQSGSVVSKIHDRDEVGEFVNTDHAVVIDNTSKSGALDIVRQLREKLFL